MLSWISIEWHKIAIALTTIISVIVHWEEVVEKFDRLIGIKKWIVRRIGDRRHIMSFATVINGIALAEKDALALSAFMAKLPEYLPAIQKQLGDLQKATADRSDPAALIADSSVLLNDLNTDLALVVPMIQNLLPTLKAPSVTPTPPAVA